MRRRQFLRGAGGLVLGLPFLESLVPRTARAATDARRFLVFFTCNGVARSVFRPNRNSGALSAGDFSGRGLEPLASLASKITIPRGIGAAPVTFGNDDHIRGMTSALTARERSGTFPSGSSVDVALAEQVNPSNVPSFVLGVQTNSGAAGMRYCSFRNGSPVTPENSPRAAYEDLLGMAPVIPPPDDGGSGGGGGGSGGGGGGSGGGGGTGGGSGSGPTPQELVYLRRKSILDLVARDEFNAMFGRALSRTDRVKLERHYDLVRGIENQIIDIGLAEPFATSPSGEPLACTLSPEREDQVEAQNGNYSAIGRMQMDILALAIACGATRVGVLQWSRESGGPIFNFDGMNHTLSHHVLSHRGFNDDGGDNNNSNPNAEAQVRQIDRWYAEQFAYLANLLDSYDEGTGSVLDNTALVWVNGLSDGVGHTHHDMPYVIAGSLGGYLKTGQVIALGSDPANRVEATNGQLWTTIMNGMGAPTSSFGETCGGGGACPPAYFGGGRPPVLSPQGGISALEA